MLTSRRPSCFSSSCPINSLTRAFNTGKVFDEVGRSPERADNAIILALSAERAYVRASSMAAPHGLMKYNGIIADPDLQTRMRLKQATASVVQFGEIAQVGHLSEAVARLEQGKKADVVFISHRYTDSEVTEFITRAKGIKSGEDTAFIRVLKSSDQQNSTIAQNMMSGSDGFLFEPYSVDQLVEITNLAARIKKECSDMRDRVAMTLMMGDIITQIDLVSFLKASGFEVSRSAVRLKDLCEKLKAGIKPESMPAYYEVAIKLFSDAPLPKPMFQAKKYQGVSSRVKKKMEEKIMAEVEKVQSGAASISGDDEKV